ncbi:MAG: hypothetical protein LBJ14_05680 [Desulfarculales bacterium]|jgi:hypothetical protein|nr:hypothetical protein [Desulfarculales bacterium]
MSRHKQKIDSHQTSLFDFLADLQFKKQSLPMEGSLNIQQKLRISISQALKECTLSRYQVAASMSELISSEVSKSMLDAYTAESKEYHRFPAEYIPAFCKVTNCFLPLEIMAKNVGMFVVPGAEALRAEIQRLDEQEKKIKIEKKKRLSFLEQIDAQL